ncbi:unnamed protein product, partial [Effrenium voratum]
APCGDQQVLRRVVDQVAAAVNKTEKEQPALCNDVCHLPNCVGCYQGATSPEVLDATEGADILLTIGMPRAEFDLLGSTGFKEERVIELGHDSVNLQGTVIQGVYLQQLLPCLAAQITPRAKLEVEDTFAFSYSRLPANPEQTPLTMDFLYHQLAHFVQEGDIVAGNTGGYVSMSRMRLKRGTVTAGPGNWASLGSAFPISMGMAFAAPERRVVCLDGDGSFQMTGMELGTLLRHNLRFMLIILNNAGYTAERVIHPEREDSYNDIQVWNYHLLPEALGAGKGIGVEVSTENQLCEALTSYQGDGPCVLNARSYHIRRVKLDRMVTNIQKICRGVLVRRALRQHRAAVKIQKRRGAQRVRLTFVQLSACWHLRAEGARSEVSGSTLGLSARTSTSDDCSSEASSQSSGPMGLSDTPQEGRLGRSMARSERCATKDRRTAVSPFRSLPELHPHEVELRVAVKDLSRDVAPEKFRSKAKSVGGFVFGLLVFPQGTKSAPEHARKNRPGKKDDDKKDDKEDEKSKVLRTKKAALQEKEKVKAALLKEVPKEKDNAEDGAKKEDGKDKKDTRWISAFVEARPSEDYPAHWYFEDVQFLVSLINFQDLKKSIVKHDKHTFSPVESSDGKAIDRGWHDFVHCDEVTLRSSGFVDKDDTVCFRASVYLAGGAMKVNSKNKSRYMSLGKIDPGLYEKVPNYLNSIVQVWYHLGFFRNAIYSASITGQMSGQKKSCVLPALREIFVRLQHRTMPASCSVLCAAFGRKGWSRVCKADPDGFCTEVFHCLESEFIPSEMLKAEEAAVKAAAKAKGKAAKAIPKVVEVPQENRALWETVQEMFEFEVEWIAQAIDGDFSDSSVYQGPCFTLAGVPQWEGGFEETLRAPRGKRGRAAKAKAGAPDVNSKNKKKEISTPGCKAAKPQDREDAAASEGRRSDASSSKAGREPKPASPSPGSPGSPPAVAQAKAREPRDAKPLNGMLNGRSMNGAKPKPEPPDKASAGASAATASRPAANAAASAAANAAANATAGGSASSRSREEVEGEAVTRHPSSSSRSWPTEEGVKVYPEQLITPAHGSLDDCAQFVCALCKLVSRHPVLMRSCLHMFCSGCFNQWVQQTKPQVVCPGCQQPVRQQDVVQLESATGPGLALLHRLYSGMKVRCLYHPELEASRGQSSRGTCSWSGALLDYTAHLGNCQVHAGSGEKAADPAAAEKTARESPHTALAVGMFLATSTWEGLTTGTLPVQRGARVWVSQLDERGEWALGQLYQEWSPVSEAAWVPRCVLTPALFPVHSPFDPALHAHQAQGLALAAGDLVGVQSLHNGWSYGAKMTPLNEAGESGWYPQACISEPLPL